MLMNTPDNTLPRPVSGELPTSVLRALGSDDERVRMLAKMSLTTSFQEVDANTTLTDGLWREAATSFTNPKMANLALATASYAILGNRAQNSNTIVAGISRFEMFLQRHVEPSVRAAINAGFIDQSGAILPQKATS